MSKVNFVRVLWLITFVFCGSCFVSSRLEAAPWKVRKREQDLRTKLRQRLLKNPFSKVAFSVLRSKVQSDQDKKAFRLWVQRA
ncbi:MAG: hypothetical protein AAGJ35_11055, partial [Myxococcota bacterium]